MKNTCIVCGTEFISERRAQFCPDRPGCRQAHNRKERKIKKQGKIIAAAIAELMAASDDPNLGGLAKNIALQAESEILARLDEKWASRHPKKEITARPIIVSPQPREILYAFDPRFPAGEIINLHVTEVADGWVEGRIDGDRWNTVKLSIACCYIKLIEPETDNHGREIIDRYNTGWGQVVNQDRQTEIAPVPAYDDDYS